MTQHVMKEIERKFLLKDKLTPELLSLWYDKENISQGYLCKDENKVVRIRISNRLNPRDFGSESYLTVKGRAEGKEGISRTELETRIDSEFGKLLLSTFCENVIEKTRYRLKLGNHVWEIDQFHGANEGLWVAEIELKHEDETFEKPSFIGEEVSLDPKYTNVRLSEHPFSRWTENNA